VASNNDISQPKTNRLHGSNDVSLDLLPIRGEKVVLPVPVAPADAQNDFKQGFSSEGAVFPGWMSAADVGNAFNISAALSPYVDFVTIRLQDRSTDSAGNLSNATYRFLINPETISIARSTLNSDAFARSGWQFGVWGEDMIRVSLSGKTAGRYFLMGLSDQFAEYTESFQNLLQLQMVFENNGYWFEGEQVFAGGSGALSTAYLRRIIKSHADVEISAKEFIWYGMFENLAVSQDAEHPYLANFEISFIAWKERFRSDSPYYNSLPNNTQRGNSYQNSTYNSNPATMPLPLNTSSLAPSMIPFTNTTVSAAGQSPSQAAEVASNTLPTVQPLAQDSAITSPVFGAGTTYYDDWQGTQP
jgi:hypothetical protein